MRKTDEMGVVETLKHYLSVDVVVVLTRLMNTESLLVRIQILSHEIKIQGFPKPAATQQSNISIMGFTNYLLKKVDVQ